MFTLFFKLFFGTQCDRYNTVRRLKVNRESVKFANMTKGFGNCWIYNTLNRIDKPEKVRYCNIRQFPYENIQGPFFGMTGY